MSKNFGRPEHIRQVNPSKIYQSRASKPSSVQLITNTENTTTEEIANKINELIAALKK